VPAKSKAQQRFMGMVHAYKKGELKGSEVSKDVKDAAKGMKKKSAKDYAKTKHKGLPNKVKKEELRRLIAKYGAKKVRETIMAVSPKSDKGYREPQNPGFEYDPEGVDEGFGGELKGKDRDKFEKARKENAEVLGYKLTGKEDTRKQTLKMAHQLKEAAKRDYKAEYKKFQSSTKAKKYRAELNQYNRKKGTYGNGDGKDASHKGGRIAGFEAESKNRGRREKSRLKKEMSNPTSGIMMARKMSSLEMQQIILLAKAMKQLPGSPAQKKIKKQINVIRKKLGQAPVKESVNEATPKEKGNLRVMKPKFKKTFDMIDKDITSIYQNLGSVEADKLKKAYITAINKGLNPRTNMFMKNSAQKILDKAFKNESVNEAPISSPSQLPYSSPEAQKMAEKDIIGMSKILGKASQMSIKKMMDGVKAKKYDAFDLQRAIMSGPIRDTHTGERDFMRVLWNKVRSGFRRYSKRGKLR